MENFEVKKRNFTIYKAKKSAPGTKLNKKLLLIFYYKLLITKQILYTTI